MHFCFEGQAIPKKQIKKKKPFVNHDKFRPKKAQYFVLNKCQAEWSTYACVVVRAAAGKRGFLYR